MNKHTLQSLVGVSLLSIAGTANSSTCSCAGVPLLGSMELATPGSGRWFLAGTYQYHDVGELVSGSTTINDLTGRDRSSEAFVLEASRGLSRSWSFSAMLSHVGHERNVGGVRDKTSGLGDAIVMLKYSPLTIGLYSKTALSFGLGARIALGEDDANRNGVVLAEDLQPSTGAHGGIVWLYAARALNESTGARLYGSVSYTNNGDNDRFYQFGHETTATLGASYQTQTPWGFNVELLHRHTERDRRNGVTIPNTGGNWLDVVPSAQYHLTDKFAVKIAAKIPVSRDLNDQLQFTTKYAYRVSMSYMFGE
jgi:hypothetical protein